MLHLLWYKLAKDEEAEWRPMSYAPRELDKCELLLDHYSHEWKDYYTYQILPEGVLPK